MTNNNNTIVHHKHTSFTVKRNLFRLPILSVGYVIHYTKDNRTKTTCTIDWYDPIYNIVRTTSASTVKCPEDDSDERFAKRLAESRCKYAIYDKYAKEAYKALKFIRDKHHKLIRTEINNQTKLIKHL